MYLEQTRSSKDEMLLKISKLFKALHGVSPKALYFDLPEYELEQVAEDLEKELVA